MQPRLLSLRRLVRPVALVSAAVVLASLSGQAPAYAKPAPAFERLKAQDEHVVRGVAGTAKPFGADPAAAHALHGAPAAPVWPAAAEAVADLEAPVAGLGVRAAATPVRAGTLPVTIAAVMPSGSGLLNPSGVPAADTTPPDKVTVRVLDHRQTAGAHPNALLLRVARADGGTRPAPVRVQVDYRAFRAAFGADWAQRLHLEALPDCALDTPESPSCQARPLAARNADGSVSAEVTAAAGAGTLLAVAAGPSGPTGSFAATTLSPSGTWTAGGPSGDFSWGYPLRVPPSLGGPQPSLGLSYSSQSVDGRHAASNNQPSWIGEGFEMWPGYIERRYKSCADDMGSGANNTAKTGDQCWATDNATMSLNGTTVELIKDGSTGAWHPRTDDGSRIEHLTGATNGDNDGEYWKVTTADGTQYFFGRNRLPGWTSGKPETNAAWTMPIFGNNPGEPCYQATFDASSCTQAWRWNLDHVVDPHGNSLSYRYATETNKYARNLSTTNAAGYVRGGYLTEADYGTRASAEYGTAPTRVLFAVADRCLPNTTCDSAHPASWPDVPWDQSCTGNPCYVGSPTFWTTKRLSSVTTQVWGGSAYRDVESWTFKHTFPDPGDGTMAGLWLAGIGHSGLVAGTSALPDVTFTGVQMPNRVDTVDHSPAMNWWRIASIRNETGGEISVAYSGQDCVAGGRMPSAPESNTMRCYPVIWTPQGYTDPVADWFHKYVVTAVAETDHTGGAPRVVTTYTYKGTPAWHYTDDDGLTPPGQKTWSQWRGYETVAVTKGDPGEQSYGETRYFRGMDGDHLPNGTRHVSVADSRGGSVADSDAYAGRPREAITYDGPGGSEISGVITDLWRSSPTATRTVNGVTVTARYVETGGSTHRIKLDGLRGYRQTRVTMSYDASGMISSQEDLGDIANASDDQCTRYTYARNTSAWLTSYPSRVETYALACDKTPAKAADVIGDARTSYDGQAWGVPPTRGDVTRVESLKDWADGAPSYTTTARSAYDSYGRITDAWDALDAHTAFAYSPAGGPLKSATVTNALGHVTTTDIEPAWGLTTGVTDPNGRRTDFGYDPLGRTTAVWLPGRSKGVQPANSTFKYLVRTNGPVAVTTQSLGPNGSYVTGYELYDGLLRRRQSQVPAAGPSGGGVVTDTRYDTAGRASATTSPYVIDAAPGTTLFTANGDNQIPGATQTLYDGSDRPVASVFRSFGVEKWRTTTAYGGDRTDVTPPPGGTPTSTLTDARGRVTQVRQYAGTTTDGSYDTTTFAYNGQGRLATITDPRGATWSYGYDLAGRRIRLDDPDKGRLAATYDDAGRVSSTTDGRGRTLAYAYDALGRRTALYDGSASGTKLAEWTYDTLLKGQLTSSTRWADGSAYTTAITGYDAGYRPTGMSIGIPAAEGALAGTYRYTATYKPDGSLSTSTLPGVGDLPQETVSSTYDDAGRPATLSGTTSYVTSTEYTRFGEAAVLTMSTGGPIAQAGYYYDESTRRLDRQLVVRQTAPSTLADIRYAWDPTGNLTRISDAPPGQQADTQCFAYDAKRRLTEAWTPGDGSCAPSPSASLLGGPAPYWQSFGYDSSGDRISSVDHATPAGDVRTTYQYPEAGSPQPHAPLSVTTTGSGGTRTDAYGYDAAGNTTTRPAAGGGGGQKLTWDAEGNLAGSTDVSGGSTFVYGPTGDRLIRRDPAGATLYLPGQELRLESAGGRLSTTRFYSHGGQTVAQRTSAGVTWLVSDHQQTAQIAIAATGSQAYTRRRQTPFGEERGQHVTWTNEHGFVGGVNDPDGLVHEGAREYDPHSGRFVSADPVLDAGDPQAIQDYAYSANNPVTFSDPSGAMFTGPGGGDGDGDAGQQQQQQVPPGNQGGGGFGPPTSTPAPQQSGGCGWNPWCWAQAGWDWVQSTVKAAAGGVAATVKAVVNWGRNELGALGKSAHDTIQDLTKAVTQGAQSFADFVKNVFSKAVSGLKNAGDAVVNKLKDVKNFVKQKGNEIGDELGPNWTKLLVGGVTFVVATVTGWGCGLLLAASWACRLIVGGVGAVTGYALNWALTDKSWDWEELWNSIMGGVAVSSLSFLSDWVGRLDWHSIEIPRWIPSPTEPVPWQVQPPWQR
ncbi:RHS repeat-associated core domain-containing protein [Microbispora sp. NPDC049125]|uniref:RHS repeat-associated core domain-containing protein n=1 Tax=Microbispora sp. NPDC049125 TaxID=3154929 RepID=UPI0034656DB4